MCKSYTYSSVFLADNQGFEGPDCDPRSSSKDARESATAAGGEGPQTRFVVQPSLPDYIRITIRMHVQSVCI